VEQLQGEMGAFPVEYVYSFEDQLGVLSIHPGFCTITKHVYRLSFSRISLFIVLSSVLIYHCQCDLHNGLFVIYYSSMSSFSIPQVEKTATGVLL
jgi:hypothetical protein